MRLAPSWITSGRLRNPGAHRPPQNSSRGRLLDDRRPARPLSGGRGRRVPHAGIGPPGVEHHAAGTRRRRLRSEPVAAAVHAGHRPGCRDAQGSHLDLLASAHCGRSDARAADGSSASVLAHARRLRNGQPERMELTRVTNVELCEKARSHPGRPRVRVPRPRAKVGEDGLRCSAVELGQAGDERRRHVVAEIGDEHPEGGERRRARGNHHSRDLKRRREVHGVQGAAPP